MLQTGDQAPLFSLLDADLERVDLSRFLGQRRVVLYFYPRDDTPGCTLEALEFTDLHPDYEALGTEILGISRDSCVSHGAFRDKHGISVRLLADLDGEVCEAYGVWRVKEAHGDRRMGILRSTFIITPDGRIRHALYDVKPRGHAGQVLDLVRALPPDAAISSAAT
ncbi:peroxiredoxin [Thioalkalicoccus limnaeus]|uniref:thioredoxin-dependent peroxiredoxin n=1 Tax=Thioalkalicoccus limnaeus TaxID=120681 RepID=A0ABV4BI84_9GAMM